MRPLIGIPMCLDDRDRWHPKRQTQHIDNAYARAVEAGGGLAVCLPVQEGVDELLSRVDGLLIPGGADFLPERDHSYPPEVAFDPIPTEQLAFDLRLLDRALERGMPLLGICYGMQLLALRRGGSLHYDLPSDQPGAGEHRLPEPDGRHALVLEPDTRLAGILGDAGGAVNSRHHQAVSDPGPELRVCARAGDGLIEAVERASARFCIGVQWHPEGMDGAHRERLFGAFVAAAGQAARSGPPRGAARRDAQD